MRSEHETTFGDVNTLLGAAPYVRCNELQGSLRKRLLFKIKITVSTNFAIHKLTGFKYDICHRRMFVIQMEQALRRPRQALYNYSTQ